MSDELKNLSELMKAAYECSNWFYGEQMKDAPKHIPKDFLDAHIDDIMNHLGELPELLGQEINSALLVALADSKYQENIKATAEQLKRDQIEDELQRKEEERKHRTDVKNGVIVPKEKKELKYKSAKELLESDAPPIEYIVDIILAKGLIVLTAKSKLGKSWFALQLAVAVASGERFLGFHSNKGGVLYIDLENTESLSKSRLIKVLRGADPPDGLIIINEYTTLNDTFLADLTEYLEDHKDTSLVIVDVFQKIKKPKKNNQSDYDDIYQQFTPLKELTDKYNIGLILVMHERKQVDITDQFANTLGSTAIMGASDQMLSISKRERKDIEAKLAITGRTVSPGEYVIKFTDECVWEMVGDAEEIAERKRKAEYDNDPIVKTIKKLVNNNGGNYKGTTTEIIEASEWMHGCRIYQKPQACGKRIKALLPLLEQYDGIEHFTTPNGNASSAHEFKRIFCLD